MMRMAKPLGDPDRSDAENFRNSMFAFQGQQEPITLPSRTFNAARQTTQETETIRMLIGIL